MATVFDLGLLKEFSNIFAWLLVFVVIFAVLGATNIFHSRGVNALIALAVTVLLSTTTGTTDVIRGLIPWFVIVAFFILFLIVLAKFAGIPAEKVVSSFPGTQWWIFTALIIGLIISLVAGGQFSRGDTTIDPQTGQEVSTPGRAVINILTEPRVLALILILGISAITVGLMAGGTPVH